MDKIEYSDINKFLVSFGLTLIVVACLLPWLYLREPFDLVIEKAKINELTEEAQRIISVRQSFISKTIDYVQFVSLGFSALGLISIITGLRRWYIKQKDLDKREKIITSKHEHELNQLTKEQVTRKADNEFESIKETKGDDPKTNQEISKATFVPKYLQLERIFFEKLMTFLYPDFKILSNNSLDIFEYDIILQPIKENRPDYIFEIKYYPNGYNKYNLQDAILRLAMGTKHYINKTGRQAQPIIVVVTQQNDFDDNQRKELNMFTSSTMREFRQIAMASFYFDEFEKITKDEILAILDKSDSSLRWE